MSFIIDQQSLEDLNILGKYRPNSLFSVFNVVRTDGGEKLLETLFHTPLQEHDRINERSSIFRAFQSLNLAFPFERSEVRCVENYLNSGGAGLWAASVAVLQKKISQLLLRSEQFEQLCEGLTATIGLLRGGRDFLGALVPDATNPYQPRLDGASAILNDRELTDLLHAAEKEGMTLVLIARLHAFFMGRFKSQLLQLLEIIHELDVYVAVASVSSERGFGYATALPETSTCLSAVGLRHPALAKPVANTLTLGAQHNGLFLTGANMAGKSTLMKSIGVNLYLAHLGFPVAAQSLEFSVMDGIYSSINVPDNIQQGYSHFYAEVLRVKKVAVDVSSGKRLLVLFDELFKGTNVQDAYDATLAVVEAFATYHECFFVVSTHIIEVGEALQNRITNMLFQYLPTVLEGTKPRYTYRLSEGITSDRQGMMIIENEQILELIKGKK